MAKKRKSRLSEVALSIGKEVTSSEPSPKIEENKAEEKATPTKKEKPIPKAKAAKKEKKLTNADHQKRYRKKVKILYISEEHHEMLKAAAKKKKQTIKVFVESLIETVQE